MKKETANKEYVILTLEIREDLYFRMLDICVKNHITVDKFIEEAITNACKTATSHTAKRV